MRRRRCRYRRLPPVPTGTPIRDIREQLLDAAERVLLRDGPDAVTSRAVTTEARVAKGILHRHFPDFGTFLALALNMEVSTRSRWTFRARPGPRPRRTTSHALRRRPRPQRGRDREPHPLATRLAARLRLTTTPTGVPLLAENGTK